MANFCDQIRQRFVEARRKVANEQVLEPRGLSFDAFYQGGGIMRLPPDLAMVIDNAIQRLRLEVTIMLAGVDQTGAHIFTIEDPGASACFDRVCYHAIGSGHRHAMLTLVAQSQHRTTGINQTIFNVYTAKRAAEAAPGVGNATEMRVITTQGVLIVDQTTVKMLSDLYEKKINAQIPEISEGVAQLPFEGGYGDGKERQ